MLYLCFVIWRFDRTQINNPIAIIMDHHHLAPQSMNGNTEATSVTTAVTTANNGQQDGGAAKVTPPYAMQKKQEAAIMKRKLTDALKLNSIPKKTLKEMNGSEDTSVSKNTVKEGGSVVSTSKNAAKETNAVISTTTSSSSPLTTSSTTTSTSTATGKITKPKQIVAKPKQIRVQKFAQIYEPDTDDESNNVVAPSPHPPTSVVANNKLFRKGTQKIPIESAVHDVAVDENLHDDDEDDNRNNLDEEEQELHNEFDQYIAHVDDDDNVNDNSNEVNVVANIATASSNIIRHPSARPKNMNNYMSDAISWIERPLDKYKSYSLLTRAFGYEYNSSNSFLRHGGIFDLLRIESTFFNFWEHGLNIFIGTNMGTHSIYPLYFTRRVCNDHEFVCKPSSNCKIEEIGAAGSSMTFFVAGVFRAVKTTFPSFFVELSNCCRIEMATKNVANTLSIKNTCTPCTHYLTACKHTDCGVGVSITPFDGMDCLYNICSRINYSFQAPLREDYNGKFCYVRGKGLAGKYHTASNTIYITTWDITDLYIFN